MARILVREGEERRLITEVSYMGGDSNQNASFVDFRVRKNGRKTNLLIRVSPFFASSGASVDILKIPKRSGYLVPRFGQGEHITVRGLRVVALTALQTFRGMKDITLESSYPKIESNRPLRRSNVLIAGS